MANPKRICSVEGCGKPQHAHGYCSSHATRLHRYGSPLGGGKPRNKRAPLCSVEGCHDKSHSHGLSGKHYMRMKRHGDTSGGGTPWGEPFKYLVNLVDYQGDDCPPWPYAKTNYGYGVLRHKGRNVGAHRLMCELAHGPAPTDAMDASHSCGNGHLGCVNPKHLRWDTRSGNHADKVEHGTTNRGEAHPSSKLTEDQVREIRSLAGKMTNAKVAEMFGVSAGHVCYIQKRREWTWLE